MSMSDEIEAYAAYLNAHPRARAILRPEELDQYEQDMWRARAAMETAWLSTIPADG